MTIPPDYGGVNAVFLKFSLNNLHFPIPSSAPSTAKASKELLKTYAQKCRKDGVEVPSSLIPTKPTKYPDLLIELEALGLLEKSDLLDSRDSDPLNGGIKESVMDIVYILYDFYFVFYKVVSALKEQERMDLVPTLSDVSRRVLNSSVSSFEFINVNVTGDSSAGPAHVSHTNLNDLSQDLGSGGVDTVLNMFPPVPFTGVNAVSVDDINAQLKMELQEALEGRDKAEKELESLRVKFTALECQLGSGMRLPHFVFFFFFNLF